MSIVPYIAAILLGLFFSYMVVGLSALAGPRTVYFMGGCLVIIYIAVLIFSRRMALQARRTASILSLISPAFILMGGLWIVTYGRYVFESMQGPPESFKLECKIAGVNFLKQPTVPVKSIALDWPARVRRKLEPRYELSSRGRLETIGGIAWSPQLEDHVDFFEHRNLDIHGSQKPEYIRFQKYVDTPIDLFSADVLVFDDVSNPEELDKPVSQEGLIRHTLTVTDRRNGEKLATMVYLVDVLHGRACGTNVKNAIDVNTFILQASGIPIIVSAGEQQRRSHAFSRLFSR